MASTLFEKLWQRHVVADLGDGFHLMLVGRHLLNDMGGRAFITLDRRDLRLAHPELTFATMDHTVATLTTADPQSGEAANPYVVNLREAAKRHGFRLFDLGQPEFGIIHVIAAERTGADPSRSVGRLR